jgi:tyrosinase
MPAIPLGALAQTVPQQRLEWKAFRPTNQYQSLLTAVAKMKKNTNSGSPSSWTYWTNIHLNRCPHGVAYFLAWHRGYLAYFERQLRIESGDSTLVLPYWDYYSYATMPPEFTDPSNPLYVSRVNTNVRQALTMAPFSSQLTNFQRGMSSAFEPSVEGAPHNPIHNIIGNVMATMRSPVDPIFWLHHANIDRLWVAWVAAGGGRKMPLVDSSYWSGNHVYTNTLTMARKSTYETRSTLQYSYQNETMPTSLPLAQVSTKEKIFRVQAMPDDVLKTIPAVGSFKVTGARATGPKTFAVGGALNVGLSERSVSAQVPVNSDHWAAIQAISKGHAASVPGSAAKYRSVRVVLDNVELADAGKMGGYYYQVYLNVPSADGGANAPTSILLGTLGAFEINGASHHGPAQLRYVLPRGALPASALRVGLVSVSFVRIDGDNSPRGPAVGIGEARVELSTDDEGS